VAGGVTAVAAGDGFTLFLKSDGSLWAMGNNESGQLGDGTYGTAYPYATNRPERIVSGNVTAIAAGGSHSLFLKTDGSLWAMGFNQYGQLGDGTCNNTNKPEQIVAGGVTAIAAGDGFSMFIKSDGSLWGMGDDGIGQLGDGNYYSQTNQPEQIVAGGVKAVAAGFDHTLFLKTDGSLWAMGWNQYGQLGDGTWNRNNLPEQIVAGGVTAIAAGGAHSLFIMNDGSLWGMGRNDAGQVGDDSYNNLNLPEQIVAGIPPLPPGYNQISIHPLSGGPVQLSFVGFTGTNYALDLSFSLSPPNWLPQVTNPAGLGGVLLFTNTPDPTTNNFWRIRYVP
jgi:alpha-tubulin suppressor-like RCC1 family protein